MYIISSKFAHFLVFRGIGLALCEQLLASHPNLTLCLACRNKQRAEQAKESLLSLHPGSKIDIVIVDTSCVKSVLEAARVLRERYWLILAVSLLRVRGRLFLMI